MNMEKVSMDAGGSPVGYRKYRTFSLAEQKKTVNNYLEKLKRRVQDDTYYEIKGLFKLVPRHKEERVSEDEVQQLKIIVNNLLKHDGEFLEKINTFMPIPNLINDKLNEKQENATGQISSSAIQKEAIEAEVSNGRKLSFSPHGESNEITTPHENNLRKFDENGLPILGGKEVQEFFLALSRDSPMFEIEESCESLKP